MACSKSVCASPVVATSNPLQKQIQDDFLVCAVCYNAFTEPKNLNCGHIFCLGCVQGIVEARKKKSSVPCPVCRKKTELPRKGPKKLPDCYVVSGMISMLKKNAVTENLNEESSGVKARTGKHKPAKSDSLVSQLVKVYEKSKQQNNNSPNQRITKPAASTLFRKKEESCSSSGSSEDDDSDDSSSDDDDESDSDDDSSDESSSDGDSIGSQDSTDSDLDDTDENDLSQVSWIVDGEDDGELTLNSSDDSFDDSDESSSGGSSDEYSSEESDSDSDSDSSEEDEPQRPSKKVEKEAKKKEAAASSSRDSRKNEAKAKPSTSAAAKENKATRDGNQKASKPTAKPRNADSGKQQKKEAALKDITSTSRINIKDSLKDIGRKLTPNSKKKEDPKKKKKKTATTAADDGKKSSVGKATTTTNVLKSCNGMRIGSEILVFAGTLEPITVKLIWLEKIAKKPGDQPLVYAGVELKTKESFKVRLSKDFRSIKDNKSKHKNWLKDEKKLLRAVVPIHQCVPKNLLQAITTMAQLK